MSLTFDACFPYESVEALAPFIEPMFEAMNAQAPWMKDSWPTRIECMSKKDIMEGRSYGAGHGEYRPDGNRVLLNPYMSTLGLLCNLIHEMSHAAWPDATEVEINTVITPHIYKMITGKKLDLDQARREGFGPPVRGIPGRGYAGT